MTVWSKQFVGGRKRGNIVSASQLESRCIVWPIVISRLLNEIQSSSSFDLPVMHDSTSEYVMLTRLNGGDDDEISLV